MKIETLRERIEKKEAQIVKKHNTIEKKQKWIEKKEAQIEKKEKEIAKCEQFGGWYQDNMTDKKSLESEVRWLTSEIITLNDDIKRITNEIKEAEATLEKYNKQLAGEIEKEAQFIKEVPQQAKDMEQMLIEKWDESDKARRERIRKDYAEMGYKEFVKKHGYNRYGVMQETDEEIHTRNVKDARVFVLDLLNRTKEITGEIKSWDGVHLTVGTNGFPVLNGYVEGKEGRAVVESIYAGGYNIQKLHVRVLVKAC